MAFQMGPEQFIYDRKHFVKMKDYSSKSFLFYNRTMLDIILGFYCNGKINALTKASMNDTLIIQEEQRNELKKMYKLLQNNSECFKDAQIRRNFYAFMTFSNTTYGKRLTENLGDLTHPKQLDWCGVVNKLMNSKYDFEHSDLLANWVSIGEKIEAAFQKEGQLQRN